MALDKLIKHNLDNFSIKNFITPKELFSIIIFLLKYIQKKEKKKKGYFIWKRDLVKNRLSVDRRLGSI